MSRLTEALESFYNLLSVEYPTIASLLQPGLTREEINAKVKNLQFSLPEEVYELYQWRNGMQQYIRFHMQGFRNNLSAYFCSLEEALSLDYVMNSEYLTIFWCSLGYGAIFFAVSLGKEETSIAHYYAEWNIGKYDFDRKRYILDKDIIYLSLTDLILVIAECYRQAILANSSHNLIYIDRHKFEQIHFKYMVQS